MGRCEVLGVLVMCVLMSPGRCADMGVCDYLCECHPTEDSLSVLCSRKSLSSIPQDIPAHVTNLDLSENNMPVLESWSFPYLPQLRSVNMQHSGIERLEGDVFRNLPALEEIQLNHNAIASIASSSFQYLGGSIHRLFLDHNRLTSLPESLLSGLRLESLSLQDNAMLTSLAPAAFHNVTVEVLSLDRCNISLIPRSTLQPLAHSLRNLMWSSSMRDLTIAKDTFTGFNFTMLNLFDDGLTSLDFLQGNFSVHSLDVHGNPLGAVDLSGCTGLHSTETLVMKRCNISGLTASSTNLHLASLHHLDISENKLTSLDYQLFQHMSSLRRLTLTANHLTALSSQLKPVFSRLEMLDVYGMVLDCDCRLDWFRRWIQSSQCAVTGAHCSDGVTDLAHVGTLICTRPVILALDSDANASSVSVSCTAQGIPAPSVYWMYTDGDLISAAQQSQRALSRNATVSRVSFRHGLDPCASVQCVAENSLGRVSLPFHACIEGTTQGVGLLGGGVSLPVGSVIGWSIGGGLVLFVIALFLVVLLHKDVRRHCKSLVSRPRPSRPGLPSRDVPSSSTTCLVTETDEDNDGDEATLVL